MVKRKEVKIDEEQIRSMMTEDIPDAVLKNIWDDNDTGSPKEDGKEPETENRSGIPANPDEVKDTGTSAGEEATSPVSQATIRRKRNTLQVYPEHLFNNSVVKERRQTYVNSENYERVRTLLSVIAPSVSFIIIDIFSLYLVFLYSCHAASPAMISLLLAMNFRFARTDSIIACALRVTTEVFSPMCLAMVRNELPVS